MASSVAPGDVAAPVEPETEWLLSLQKSIQQLTGQTASAEDNSEVFPCCAVAVVNVLMVDVFVDDSFASLVVQTRRASPGRGGGPRLLQVTAHTGCSSGGFSVQLSTQGHSLQAALKSCQ